jgi:uncharacterized SAM-binding protein YcdF (DUF218 family)
MKTRFPPLGNLWLWLGMALCFPAGLVFNGMAGHGFLAMVCFCLGALLGVYKALELLKRHKWAKITIRVLTVLVALGLILVTVTGIVIGSHCGGDLDVECEYAVVLGAGVHGTTPSLSLHSRLVATAEYLRQRPEVICILSGGQGDGEAITEARCMYDWLVAEGIPPEQLWMEEQATSTEENLRFSLDLLEEQTGTRPETIGLISSEYHLFRAGIFAKECGVTAIGIPAQTSWFSIKINYFMREVAGVWHYILLGY